MLRIHEAVAVISRAYPDRLPDRGQDLKKDHFYHRLRPYLHDALSFAMAELPEREQARPTFDTLYTLTKKLEVGQPACMCQYTTSSEVYIQAQALPCAGGPGGSPGGRRVGII